MGARGLRKNVLFLVFGTFACSDNSENAQPTWTCLTQVDGDPCRTNAGFDSTVDRGAAGAAAAGSGGAGLSSATSGTGSSGSGGNGVAAGVAGTAVSGNSGCETLSCPSDMQCQLVQVTCVRAPCPPQPQCVAVAGSAALCGTRGAAACPASEYCRFPAGGHCGANDGGGSCTEKPAVCTDQLSAVCGCDSQTYGNECMAAMAGVGIDHSGACGSPALNDCDPRKILCRQAPPKCAGGTVPSVLGSCYGGCVPVESCGCSAPEACPLPDEYTCHMSAGHCGPFV
jgi:Kazal-type serine protease inhibitor-like protein